MAGLMDIALHPRFAENKWVYISYHKPRGTAPDVNGKDYPVASNAIMRGTWNGKTLTDITDVYVSDDVDMEMSRIAFGRDGMLYMTIGGPGTGPPASLDRPQHGNDDAGKILRMTDEGKVPPDNPFVGKAGFKPYIYTMGHRTQLALALNPFTGEMWAGEQGPNGGDEVNILRPGRNYGWPFVSDGRDYRGHYLSPTPYRDGMERPHVLWVPSIAVSGHGVLHRRSLPELAAQPVRRRDARGRDRADRPAAAHRVQRQLGRAAPRVAAAGSAPAHPRRAPGARRPALRADRGGRRRAAADRARSEAPDTADSLIETAPEAAARGWSSPTKCLII